METLQSHLEHMLLYVGRSLQENAQAAAHRATSTTPAKQASAPTTAP
jgi:hypothetical protein